MDLSILGIVFPAEMARLLAGRVRTLRVLQNFRRETLAFNAGVSVASLKRFERTGQASLDLLLRVAAALGRLEEFGNLLAPPPTQSIADLERASAKPARKRGTR